MAIERKVRVNNKMMKYYDVMKKKLIIGNMTTTQTEIQL